MTADVTAPTKAVSPRRPGLDHDVAMRLAVTEYERVADAAARLQPDEWTLPTCNTGWNVRDMLGHVLGMARMSASLLEQRSQTREATRRGGVWIDALTALQVERTAALTPSEVVAELRATGRKAARARRRMPGFIRRRPLPIDQAAAPDAPPESWTLGYLIDVILTRDPWTHRGDLAAATGHEMLVTAEHDGVLVADAVSEWADRHGQPCSLTLTGPAGGTWQFGSGGPAYELDAIEFCRILSGRGAGDGLLQTRVPF